MSTLTVGTITEKVADAGVAVDGVTLKDGGATLTSDLTIGDASASDKKILFDGNAVDYHIGLDDSADSLIIGKGSALGTTTSMAINADGVVTKPLQPAFLITNDSPQDNPSNEDTVVFGTEVFDQNNDVSSNTFTAPVTGRYFLNAGLRIDNMSSLNNHHSPLILTSNREFRSILEISSNITYHHFHMSALADMDAGDTAVVKFKQSGGTGGADIPTDATRTHFSGYLVA